jgi:hypothetical protein
MKKIKRNAWVFLYNIILIVAFVMLVYFVREWWLLFMLLCLESFLPKEAEEELTNDNK